MCTAAHPCYPFTQVPKALLDEQDEPGECHLQPKIKVLYRGLHGLRNSVVQSASRKGNVISLNGISFNRILFPFVSVKPNLPASVNRQQH